MVYTTEGTRLYRNLINCNEVEQTQLKRAMEMLGVSHKSEAFRQILALFVNDHPHLMCTVEHRDKDRKETDMVKGYRNALYQLKERLVKISFQLTKTTDPEERSTIDQEIKSIKNAMSTLKSCREEDYILNEVLVSKEKMELDLRLRDVIIKENKLDLAQQLALHNTKLDLKRLTK